jgi:tetratricopeptide (TPR) repeat protein
VSPKLNDEIHKTYLNGCAEYAESGDANPNMPAVVDMFEKVANAEPRFRAAWAKLLLAENSLSVQALATSGSDAEVRRSLRRHIAEARRRHGTIPEVLLAEIDFLPYDAYAERLKLADAARELEPDNPSTLVARARELSAVGRSSEAASDAARALELDPLSPAMRNYYINTLAYSGRTDAAAEALKEAERIWPGTGSVADAKFRFHLRYGDPAVALELYRSLGGTSQVHEATMRARLDPTPANLEHAAALARTLLVRFGDVAMYSQIMAELGLEEEIYASIARLRDALPPYSTDTYFRPTLKKFRQDPRFIGFASRLGLLDYWRTSGKWPDFCFQPDLPYDCKAEAAKLAA